MNYKEFYVLLPIKDNNVKIVDGLVQYDTANVVHVRLMSGTEPFDFTGYTEIILDILKPDGNHIKVMVTDDPAVNDDNNPYWLQVIEPTEGRVSFVLQGQATILTGTHFAQLSIMGEGKMLTSARINYYVGDTLSEDMDPPGVVSSSEYTGLQNLINRNSAIASAENERVEAETLRKLAEQQREQSAQEQAQYVQSYIDNAKEYVSQTEDYMELAYQYAQLAQNPSAEIMQSLITSLDLAATSYVDTEVVQATRNFDAGSYTDGDETKKLLKVRRGASADIPTLEEGELGYSTDTDRVYIGSGAGNIPINGVFVASATAPAETHVLWIDTSAAGGGAIKYFDGSAWQPTATATFA